MLSNNYKKNMNSRILGVGSHIDIQRADGRVHSAIVRAINHENSSVGVEWFEKGEPKRKEVDLAAITNLNPCTTFPEKAIQIHPQPNFDLTRTDNEQCPIKPPRSVNYHPTRQSTSIINEDNSLSTLNIDSSSRSDCDSKKLNSCSSVQKTANTGRNQISSTASNSTKYPRTIQSRNGEGISYSLVNSSFGWIKSANTKVAPKRRTIAHHAKPAPMIFSTAPVSTRDERRQRSSRFSVDSSADNSKEIFLSMIKEFQKKLHYTPLSINDKVDNHMICVCVRKRPLSYRELKHKEIDVVTIPNKQHMIVHEPKLKVDLTKYLENQNFKFDYTFNEFADNYTVYRFTARPLVECIFEGGMATCFAYGQTGSGKSHTMGGEFISKGIQNYSNGIYAMAAKDVFDFVAGKYEQENYYVECAYFEIYGGKVFDLLHQKKVLRILEDNSGNVQIVGLKMELVQTVEDVMELIQSGMHIRTIGHTSANINSSRSHGIFQLVLRKPNRRLKGKISLIDLAGNERGADVDQCDRITRLESGEINKSLLALKECIRALGKKGVHRPFRASKLTQILRDSFIGENSRTCMISMISPGMQSCDNTINTLRYADRVKELNADKKIKQSNNCTGQKVTESVKNRNNSKNNIAKGNNPSIKMQANSRKKLIKHEPKIVAKSNNLDNEEEDDCVTIKDSFSGRAHGRTFSSSTYTEVANEENHNSTQGFDETLVNHDIGNDSEISEGTNSFRYLDYTIDSIPIPQNNAALNSQKREVFETHRYSIGRFTYWGERYEELLEMGPRLDFDAAEYATLLAEALNEQIAELTRLRECVRIIRNLQQEIDQENLEANSN